MRRIWLGLAASLCLAAGLAAPVLYFLNVLSEALFKLGLLLASVGWFVFAILWSGARRRP